jgi:hypothetical protein
LLGSLATPNVAISSGTLQLGAKKVSAAAFEKATAGGRDRGDSAGPTITAKRPQSAGRIFSRHTWRLADHAVSKRAR